MSRRQAQRLADGEIVSPPAYSCDDQSFELPTAIYIAMASMFAGFIAVLSLAFRGGYMALAYGVIFALIAAIFTVPGVFPVMAARRGGKKALSLFDFGHRGIATATGRASAREATILVLLLPFLILCFGISVAAIATLIR